MSREHIKLEVKLPTIFMDNAKNRAIRNYFCDVSDYIQALMIIHCYCWTPKAKDVLAEILPKKEYNLSTLLAPLQPSITLDKYPTSYAVEMQSIGITRYYPYKIVVDPDILAEIDKEASKYRVSTHRYISFLLAKDLCDLKAYMFYRSFFDPIWSVRIMNSLLPENRGVSLMWKLRFKIKDDLPETMPGFPFKENKYDSFIPYLEESSEIRNCLADIYYGGKF